MKYILDYYNVQKLPDQSLAVVQCGYQKSMSGYTSVLRLHEDYSVTFVLEGKGTYTIDGVTHEICAGQGFLIVPNVPVTYSADRQKPWKYIYASFRGMDSEALVRNAGLGIKHPTFFFPQDENFKNILYAMHSASKDHSAKGYDVVGYFLLLMSVLIRSAGKYMQNNCADAYLEQAVSFVENNYPYHITIQDIAKELNIDRTYLYKLFDSRIGMSPLCFLNKYRLEKAIKMMEHPDLSINSIAQATGFCDASHFIRKFQHEYGMSPGVYRKKMITNP